MFDLSTHACTVMRALTSLPENPPGFDLGLARAVLGVDDSAGLAVLGELVQHGIADEHQDGQYKLADTTMFTRDGGSANAAAVEAAITWFVQQAVHADHVRDRHGSKLSSAYEILVQSRFNTPADAMFWFEPHHNWFVALLDDLVARKRYELSLTLAEAVFGLAGHGGHQRDQLHAAKTALQALGRLRFSPEWIAGLGEDPDRARLHDLRVARFNLQLAFVLSNLHGPIDALKALDAAEERGRALGDAGVLAAVHRGRGRTHHAAGDLNKAERELRKALELDLASGDKRRIYLCRRDLGAVLADLERHEEAGAELHLAAVGTNELGDRIPHARVLTVAGAAFITAGEPVKAIAPLTLALDTMKQEEAGSDAYLADIYVSLARARRATNDPTAADHCFRKAVEHYRLAHRDRAAADVEAEWHQQQ
ncbi:tetratricopeptide repeat protein [Lentzea atacamensis]|uniref:Tetratricopeptide repeat protein n=1 Tax=Lentzea atacamensis TaxID=531938 RepID=A0ABX9DW96_9PSEU|nr:tetratricopeptide repeat protein [Lentzea atacamensis]RAS59566.1 tetratricopeptide repeat protein [Lentzea atacamensis]